MKILFAGSPESSAKILNSIASSGLDVVGVISQPDKRSKRGKGKEASYVAAEALKLGIPIFKPTKLDVLFKQEISHLDFDFLVVSAYGKILPEWMLDAPNIAPINIHFSLLPKYRGASPIQTSILNSDNKTGISIMRMSKGMDEGPIYCSYEIEILESDNRVDLENKLVSLCIKNLQNDLRNILNSKLILIEQNNNVIMLFKYFGSVYLFYLASLEFKKDRVTSDIQKENFYLRGVYMNLINPKVLIFFLAYFPNFLFSDTISTSYQFIILGAIFILQALIIFTIVSIASNRLISILNVDARNKKIVYLKSFIFVLIGMSILL